jgi:hypothetical protein
MASAQKSQNSQCLLKQSTKTVDNEIWDQELVEQKLEI